MPSSYVLAVSCALFLVCVSSAAEFNDITQGQCPCQTTGQNCVSDCNGRANGDYQSCKCCHGDQAYVTCYNDRLFYRTCPVNLVWADDVKKCNYSSTTCQECKSSHASQSQPPTLSFHAPRACPCRSTGSNCIDNCTNVKDGDYQSCHCCHGEKAYVSCSGGVLFYRPCPANLVWADDIKKCNYTSSTCRECKRTLPPLPVGKCPCKRTGSPCITSCEGRKDGDYQSCKCCHGDQAYVSCVAGRIYYRSCPANLLWDDNLKKCEYNSTTCRECNGSLEWIERNWINL